MKKILLGFIALALTLTAVAQIQKKKKKMTAAQEQQAWMNYATPGAMHQWMAKMEGTWDGDMTMWMNPDSPAIKTKGVAEYKMVLGGRYLEGVHKGDMLGMPFEGRSLMAYDNHTKKFLSSWIDNMGTGVMNTTGSYNEKTKTLVSKGKMVDPAADGEIDVKEVITFIDDNTQKMEMYCMRDGKEVKTMEMIAKKRK